MMGVDRRRNNVTATAIDKRLRRILENAPDVTGGGDTLDDKVKLFDGFLKSGGFYTLYTMAIQDCSHVMSDGDAMDFERLFASRLNEDLAYLFMQHRGIGPVLSREATLDFFQWLYPGAQFKSGILGFDSIAGITVPDGLALEEQNGLYRAILFCEYTSASDSRYFSHKLNAFGIEKRSFPQIFRGPQILFVVPEGKIPAEIIIHPDVAVEFMPFDRRDLYYFSLELFRGTIPEEGCQQLQSIFKDTKESNQRQRTLQI